MTENYLKTIESLSLTDYVTYKATEEDLKNCYLDAPAQTVTVTYRPEEGDTAQEFTLHLGKAQANGKTLCTLPRAQVVTLTESFNAILLG